MKVENPRALAVHLAKLIEEFGDAAEDGLDTVLEITDVYARLQALPVAAPTPIEMRDALVASLLRLASAAEWCDRISADAGIHYKTHAALLKTKVNVTARKYGVVFTPSDLL